MTEAPKIVAITGASGYLGAQLLQQLEGAPNIGSLVAFDFKPLPVPIHRISVYRQDIAQPIDATLRRHRVDTVAHLAGPSRFVGGGRERPPTSQQALQQHQAAFSQVLNSCLKAEVKHLIYVSSHQVYGAFPDNPVPLTEASPPRCDEKTFYGYACRLLELIAEEFAENHPELKITVLRVCPVLGPSDSTGYVFPNPLWNVGGNLPFQFLHQADFTRIIEAVIHREPSGVFNVAGEGVVFLRELAEIAHRRLTRTPPFLAASLVWLLGKSWRFGSSVAELDPARYPVIISPARIKQTLGYRFNYTSLETFTAYINYTGQ